LRQRSHRFHPVEAGDAWRRRFGEQALIHPGGFDRFRAVGEDVAFGVEKFAAIVEEEIGPQRHIGILQATADEAVDAVGGIVEFFGGGGHLVEGLGQRDALLREQLLVPVQNEVIDRPRQRMHFAFLVLGELQTAGGKIIHRQV
jgi:hypothetical protein